MRFFKYLVLIFVSIISIDVHAAWKSFGRGSSQYIYPSALAACKAAFADNPSFAFKVELFEPTGASCLLSIDGGSYSHQGNVFGDGQEDDDCPPVDFPDYVYFQAGTPIPKQTCREVGAGKYCVFIDKGNRIILNHQDNKQSVVLYSKSRKSVSSCTPLLDGQCDKNDPYGGCFQPPNDGCTRQKDGSIICPDNAPPPDPKEPCNGASYCKRPPTGCGKGYVAGSFNGQQMCVRAGPDSPQEPDEPEPPKQPNDPSDPNDPNKCTISSCPRPDTDKDCPKGYYSSFHNGQAICVLNNPNPNQPNPNDPNNKEPPEGGDGTDLSGVINAIRALKDALMGAFDTLTKKTSELINGQKDTNKHLDNLNKEAVKGNGHLEKIEESTAAASETLGNMNEFLQDGKDDIPASNETGVPILNYNVPEPTQQQYLGWSPSCPIQPKSNELVINGIAVRIDSDFTLTCDMALAVRPFVLAAGAIIAFLIASGVWMGRGEN